MKESISKFQKFGLIFVKLGTLGLFYLLSFQNGASYSNIHICTYTHCALLCTNTKQWHKKNSIKKSHERGAVGEA